MSEHSLGQGHARESSEPSSLALYVRKQHGATAPVFRLQHVDDYSAWGLDIFANVWYAGDLSHGGGINNCFTI